MYKREPNHTIQVRSFETGRFPMQLQMLVVPKREQKQVCGEDASINRRVLGRIKAVQSEGKPPGGDRSQPSREARKVPLGKKSRRRRRVVVGCSGDDSDSGSQDKSSPVVPSKQIKVSKDKYCLSQNLSKLIRKSINECSHGQDKTLKVNWKQQKDKTSVEEKKKHLETFNETIRKNNLKNTQMTKEIRLEIPGPANAQSGTGPTAGCMHQLGSYVKKMSKVVKQKKDPNEVLVTPISVGVDKISTCPRGQTPNESDRRKKLNMAGQLSMTANLNDSLEGKRSQTGPQKRTTGDSTLKPAVPSLTALSPLGADPRPLSNADKEPRDKSRQREKSVDERRSSDENRRRGRLRNKKDSKKIKQLSPAENEKIKENLIKLNQKAKHAVRNQRALSKRLTRQRRSKSSNDLFHDSLVKKVFGKSEMANSRTHNEDNMYNEYKKIISREKKGDTARDMALKDKILRRSIKDKTPLLFKIPGVRSAKMKTSKSSKMEKRLESYPLKLKKITPHIQAPYIQPKTIPDMTLPDKLKETEVDLHEKIHQLSHKISKNYENIPHLLMKNKQLQSQGSSHQGTLIIQPGSKKPSKKGGRRIATNPNAKKIRYSDDEEEDIPDEEKELIEKEILRPKNSDSGYTSSDHVNKAQAQQTIGQATSQLENNYKTLVHNYKLQNTDLEDRLAEAELNAHSGSPNSVKIKDSDSSDREEETSRRARMKPSGIDARENLPTSKSHHNQVVGGPLSSHSRRQQQKEQDSRDVIKNLPPSGKTPTGDPLSQEQFDKWMYLLQEFKKCENYGYVDGELKTLITNMYEKTQRGLNQLITTNTNNHQAASNKGAVTSSDSRLHGPLPTSQSEEDRSRRRKPNLGIDVENINDEYIGEKPSYNPVVRDTRSNSFQWLRAEFEQNLDELGKLLGNNKADTLKKIQDAMELNERYSDMFELRVSAINERYKAQKDQIMNIAPTEINNPEKIESLLQQLEEWYQSEIETLEHDRKKITKGWLTSIETIQKIIRDLEITQDMKKGTISRTKTNKFDESSNIYNIISRSLASPGGRKRDFYQMAKEKRYAIGKEPSPMASPHANSGFSQSKIISDPNLHSLKMKQADVLRKNEELARSIDQLENSKGRDRNKEKSTGGEALPYGQRTQEISEEKQIIVKEIDDGLARRSELRGLGVVLANHPGFKNDDTPIGSPPIPSVDSSNLYNVSPTSIKRQSKADSSNHPRSTLKSGDLALDDKTRPEDLIWIRDQAKPRVIEANSLQNSGPSISNQESIPGIIGLGIESAGSTHRFGQKTNSMPTGVHLIPHSPPAANHTKDSGKNLAGLRNPTDSSSGDIRDLALGTHTGGTNYSLESAFRKDSERGPKQPPSDFTESQLREGKRHEITRPLVGEGEDYLNDLIQGIGFDSQAIKNDFEDTNKKSIGMDDFASMSDSDRDDPENIFSKRTELLRKLNIISDEVLDMIFTDTIPDIIQMLENENNEADWDIGPSDNQQIYLQDGRSNVLPQIIQPALPMPMVRKGIRVNFNAVKEYLSLLVNFIKGLDLETKQDMIKRLNTPFGLSANEKLASFHEGFDESSGGMLSTNRLSQRMVISSETYMKLEEEIAVIKDNDDLFRQEMQHIHNKMLFDSFNEALDTLRPFNLKGSPFPWRPNAGRLAATSHPVENIGELLEKAQEKVLDWAMFVCGFIPDKEDSMLGDIAIEEDYLNQIKEDRLIKMLTCEAFETDERWLIYDDEEVEVQTEIAELIFDQLLEEAVEFLGRKQPSKAIE